MKLQLSVIFLLLKFVFYLSTEVSGEDKYRKRLRARVVFRPTASDIMTAISDSNGSRDIQILQHLQRFFTIGQYPVDFVGQLNKFYTLTDESILLSSEEKTTLSSKPESVSRESRILTQVKFYRKIQELQCTNYVILNLVLLDVDVTLVDIAYYVYIMIEMSYKTNFAVGAWLWQLYIKLMCLQDGTLETREFLIEHSVEITETLEKLIFLCRQNDYLVSQVDTKRYKDVKSRHILMNKYLNIYDRKYSPHFQKQNQKLPIHIDELLLKPLWTSRKNLFSNIVGLAFDWHGIYLVLMNEIQNIMVQYKSGEWTTQPFKYIRCHEIVLDAIKSRLYAFLWVHLAFYKNSQNKDLHDRLIECLHYVLTFAYVDDGTFNRVLVLLSDINEPDEEKINETIDILSLEVNNFVNKYTGQNRLIKIDYEQVARNYKNDYKLFLTDHRKIFLKYFEDTETILGAFKLNIISFYINGNKTSEFVFPNKRK